MASSSRGKIIDLITTDSSFKNEVVAEPGGQHLKNCFQCSSCTLTCPVAEVPGIELNPRKIVHQVLLGLRTEVLESKAIWQCVGCFECTDRCPQNVRFTEVIEALRRIAVRSSEKRLFFFPKEKAKNRRIKLSKEGKRKHSFDKRFTESIWLWGRTWEPEYIGRYLLYGRGFPFGSLVGFRYISLMLGMLKKFKIEFFPPWVSPARKEVRRIFKRAKGRR
ncbi:MAG: 4Fe-4S dicluster domain-containing protein [Candidatus Hodarchaeales archaeon]|jgi:heterodisulfide reductase subunit C